jgi:hypothetical protein
MCLKVRLLESEMLQSHQLLDIVKRQSPTAEYTQSSQVTLGGQCPLIGTQEGDIWKTCELTEAAIYLTD